MFALIKRRQRITNEKAEALCALYLQEARGRCGATAYGNVVLIDPRCSFRHSGNEIGWIGTQHDGTQSQS
ncbi:hypothetical protein GHT06_009446 [Daphnia sinensis]|uniref:Uncharacterized protein n=1 Tax=Daphnia sinensis TaxID=1820382 RepID=A0AAD5L315_9CRUS|nr:hypothetical protein GHT06_009446 [Daphnia sinensis]